MSTGSSRNVTSRFTADAALLVCALALTYVESLVPLSLLIPLPGAKAGLAHIAVNVAAAEYGMKDASAVSVVRVVIAALLFGSLPSLAFSLTGAVAALLTLGLCRMGRSLPFSWIGISVLTAAAHNCGQLASAVLLTHEAAMLSYLPVLLLAAALFGSLTGLLTNAVLLRLEKKP